MTDKDLKEEKEILEENIDREESCTCNCENKESEEKCCCEADKNYEEEIGKLQAEVEDWKQSYLRKQADFQNFTKRKEKELEELRKFASEKIITKL